MGRNHIPKLDEWRDGYKYQFRVDGDPAYPLSDDGRAIIYERLGPADNAEILAVCWADGFQECMASMWESGFSKGKRAGREEALREVREALGVKE